MPEVQHGPIRPTAPGRYAGGWITVLASIALLAGCTQTPATNPGASTPTPSDQPSPVSTPPSTSPTAPTEAPSTEASATATATATSKPIDTSKWKTFTTSGVHFKYPPGWVIKAEECADCGPVGDPLKDPFTTWTLTSDHGISTLAFAATSATDTDGNMYTYRRTELDKTRVPGPLAKPAFLVAEHFVMTPDDPKEKTKEKLGVFITDAAEYKKRSSGPEIDFFHPIADTWAMMYMRDDFVFDFGVDEDHVSLQQAKELVATDEYAIMRAIMLSVAADK